MVDSYVSLDEFCDDPLLMEEEARDGKSAILWRDALIGFLVAALVTLLIVT